MILRKAITSILSLSCLLVSCTSDTKAPNVAVETTIGQSPLDVVTARNEAYNTHDLEAFLATYADNVQIYTYPDELMGEGVERLRRIFGIQFSEDDGNIQVHSQNVVGNMVVIDATESYFGIEQHVIAIYIIKNGKISDLRLIEPERE